MEKQTSARPEKWMYVQQFNDIHAHSSDKERAQEMYTKQWISYNFFFSVMHSNFSVILQNERQRAQNAKKKRKKKMEKYEKRWK